MDLLLEAESGMPAMADADEACVPPFPNFSSCRRSAWLAIVAAVPAEGRESAGRRSRKPSDDNGRAQDPSRLRTPS